LRKTFYYEYHGEYINWVLDKQFDMVSFNDFPIRPETGKNLFVIYFDKQESEINIQRCVGAINQHHSEQGLYR